MNTFFPRILATLALLIPAATCFSETVIIDNESQNGFTTSGSWLTGNSAGFHVTNYLYADLAATSSTAARWTPTFESGGDFNISVWYAQGSNRPNDASYTVEHASGSTVVPVNQEMNGAQWFPLGTFSMPATGGSVRVSNQSAKTPGAVIADAVKFERVGTTYGDLYQGMWVYAWGAGILSPTETDAMIATARANNHNAIFVQVRKVGDSLYLSDTEPMSSNVTPGYDPLADVLAKAHDTSGGKQRIEVHAWMVPYRVWTTSSGTTPPAGHVWHEHPEWRGQTNTGSTSDGSWYLDPGAPGVSDYLADVASEVVTKYDVDGIHWDYFRYSGTQWGYNPLAVARFNTLYGRTGPPATTDAQFSDFRRDQIRQMGRKVYAAVKAVRWNCKMSAATINWGAYNGDFTATSTYSSVMQDWPGFMEEGLLDMNVLMNYKREHVLDQKNDYRDWCALLATANGGRHAINGPGIYMNYIANSTTQILHGLGLPGIVGTVGYVYHQTNVLPNDPTNFWTTMRRDTPFGQRRNVPDAPWISSPTQGILRGRILQRDCGTTIDGASVTIDGVGTIKTDATGGFAFLKLNPGSYTARVNAPGHTNFQLPFTITAGQVTSLGDACLPVGLSRFAVE